MWWNGCGAGLLQAGGGYEAEGDGFHDHVGGVGGPELAHDVAAVGLDGILGDVEDGCDLAGVRRSVTAVAVRERSAAAVLNVFAQRLRAPAGRSGPAARS